MMEMIAATIGYIMLGFTNDDNYSIAWADSVEGHLEVFFFQYNLFEIELDHKLPKYFFY